MRAETLLSTRRPRIQSLEMNEGGRHAANGDKNIAKMQNNKSPYSTGERGDRRARWQMESHAERDAMQGGMPCGAGSMRGGIHAERDAAKIGGWIGRYRKL